MKWHKEMWVIIPYIVALLSFIVIALMMRPVADDYCQIAEAASVGPGTAVINAYQQWSGRYAAYYYAGAVGTMGIGALMLSPIVLIMGYLVTTYFILVEIGIILGIPKISYYACLSSIFLVFIFVNISGLQPIFWLAGAASYGLPALVLLLHSGFVLHGIRRQWRSVQLAIAVSILFAMLLIAAGFSESYILIQGSMLVLSTCFCMVKLPNNYKYTALTMSSASILGLGIGALIVLSAPGNAVRAEVAQGLQGSSISFIVTIVFTYTVWFLFGETLGLAGVLVTFIGVIVLFLRIYKDDQTALLELPAPNNLGLWGILFSVIAALLILLMLSVPLYTVGAVSPRTLMFPRLIEIVWMIIVAYLTVIALARNGYPQKISRRPLYKAVQNVVILLLIVYPSITVLRHVGLLEQFRIYAQEWDRRDEFIQQESLSGKQEILVEPLTYNIEDYLALEIAKTDIGGFNECMVQYYNVQQIRLIENSE